MELFNLSGVFRFNSASIKGWAMNTRTHRIRSVVLVVSLAGCTGQVIPAESRLATTSPPPDLLSPSGAPTVVRETPMGDGARAGDVGSIRHTHGMLTARAAHAATLLQDGQVLITGGFGQGDSAYADSAELYDPITGDFVFTGKMAARRCCHTATRLLDGRVLIAGGFNGDYLSAAEVYNPVDGKFTATGSLTIPRMDHVAVLLDNGKVLLAGGVGSGWTFLNSAELYDPGTGNFTPTGDITVARESHTVTKLQDGRVLITGGHRGRHSAITIYDSAEIYDPTIGVFTPTGPMNVRRHKHDAVLLSDGRVLITGGSDERDDDNAYASAEIYDSGTGIFSPVGNMPTVRYKHAGTSVLLKNGIVLIAGGARNAVLYDPRPNTFRTVPGDLGTATLSRLFSTATLMQNGSVLIVGGYGLGQAVTSMAWVYSP